jgi:CMP-N,N'-diacetyllegionaminic acid synthase
VNIAAIIPARGGSKGVSGKNIRLLGGYPLIAYSVVAAKLSAKIGRIIVSTDSEGIAEISREYGAETPFLRPAALARDTSPDKDFMLHAIHWLRNNEGLVPDYFVHLRPTTPLRNIQIIDRAVRTIINNPAASSLRSMHLAPESPFKWFQIDEQGYCRGFLAGLDNEVLNNPRQGFPKVYIPNGYVDVLKTAFITGSGRLYGNQMIGFVTPCCTEVDTVNDFDFLEYDLTRNGNGLWDYLKRYYPKRGPDHGRI